MDIQLAPWHGQNPTSLRTNESVEILNLHQNTEGVLFVLPTGEKLRVTADGGGAFQCRYFGISEDRNRTFDAGVFTFENGFPEPPSVEKAED